MNINQIQKHQFCQKREKRSTKKKRGKKRQQREEGRKGGSKGVAFDCGLTRVDCSFLKLFSQNFSPAFLCSSFSQRATSHAMVVLENEDDDGEAEDLVLSISFLYFLLYHINHPSRPHLSTPEDFNTPLLLQPETRTPPPSPSTSYKPQHKYPVGNPHSLAPSRPTLPSEPCCRPHASGSAFQRFQRDIRRRVRWRRALRSGSGCEDVSGFVRREIGCFVWAWVGCDGKLGTGRVGRRIFFRVPGLG